MDPHWISPEAHVSLMKNWLHKSDTLIHLGDVGNPEYLNKLNCYKILITGNHDRGASAYKPYFNEVYTGPLFISDKILLSHEPIYGLDWCMNIHGHNHSGSNDSTHINLASNVVHFVLFDLGAAIKEGMLSNITGIHRVTIDEASGGRKHA